MARAIALLLAAAPASAFLAPAGAPVATPAAAPGGPAPAPAPVPLAVQKKALIAEINFYRMELCAHQSCESRAYEKCKLFLTKMCNPGPDGTMDGSKGERTSNHGWCTEFFNRQGGCHHPSAGQETSESGHVVMTPRFANGNASHLQPGINGTAMANQEVSRHSHHDERIIHHDDLIDLDPTQIFGEPGMPDYLSTEDIEEMTVEQIEHVEEEGVKELPKHAPMISSSMKLQGPLPFAFARDFAAAVAEAVPECSPEMVKVDQIKKLDHGIREVIWRAPEKVIEEIKADMIDPHSRLVTGPMRQFFVKRSHLRSQ